MLLLINSLLIYPLFVKSLFALYPRDTPSRTIVQNLNGMWNFRADNSPNRNKGFEKKWFNDSLTKVSQPSPQLTRQYMGEWMGASHFGLFPLRPQVTSAFFHFGLLQLRPTLVTLRPTMPTFSAQQSAAGEQTINIIWIIPFHLGDFVYSAFLTQIQCHRLDRIVTIKMFLKPQLSFINGKYCLGIIVQAVVDIDHVDQIGW